MSDASSDSDSEEYESAPAAAASAIRDDGRRKKRRISIPGAQGSTTISAANTGERDRNQRFLAIVKNLAKSVGNGDLAPARVVDFGISLFHVEGFPSLPVHSTIICELG